MNGKITFPNANELGEFLNAFTGSTALFEVETSGSIRDGYTYTVQFTGGY